MPKDSKNKSAAGDERVARRKRGVAPAALLAAALMVTAVVAVSARAWLTPRTAAKALAVKEAAVTAVVSDEPQQQLPADVTLTTLNSTGFSPSEIAHEAGRFRIVVQNKSGVADLDLRLDGEQSSRWTERHELGEVQGWIAEVELAAGTYTITDSRHPEWVCHLTVE